MHSFIDFAFYSFFLADLEGEQRYISIYEDMRRKGRYFAVDVPADSCFKDIYLLPLAPGEEPPGGSHSFV